MPIIVYTADSFSTSYGPDLVGMRAADVSWPDIIWAAVSVGKAQLEHLTQYGVFSIFEITYRAAQIWANLCEDSNGALTRSSAYNGLDSSEKGAISYFIGMTLTKLFCHRLLNVPWLMHLDVYRQQLQPVLAGKSKPDFVGLNASQDWIVVEAKGRTNDYEESVLQKAKIQAQQLTTIQGDQPALRIATLAYFASGSLRFAIRDPEKDSDNGKIDNLPLTKHMLLNSCYRPLQKWLDEARSVQKEIIDDREYRIALSPEIELSVGLPVRDAGTLIVGPSAKEQHRGGVKEFLGDDGVLIRLGSVWSPENMRLQPQARNRS